MSSDAVQVGGGAVDIDDLLLRVASGSRESFAALYDAFGPRIFGLALRVAVNRSLAEEVTQETFLQVWRSASSFDPARGSAKTWILTIAHRRAVDCVRSTVASAERDARAGHRDLDVPGDVVAESSELHFERLQLRSAMAELPDVQREAISLAYFDGLSQQQIAVRTGTPLGTVKSRVRMALTRLRQSIPAACA